MVYTEYPRDHAEARMQARMARAEREHRRRRKQAIAAATITLGFVLSLTGSLVAHALRPRSKPAPAVPVAAAAPVDVQVAPPTTPPSAAVSAEPSEPPPSPAPEEPAPPEPKVPKLAPRLVPKPAPRTSETARVRIAIGSQGFEPSTVRVKAGVPVTLTVARGEGCAAGFLMPELGVQKDNTRGPVTFKVGPLKAGEYRFSCGMEMVGGSLIAE